MKRHDYAGGGEYFITICAHREFIGAAKGRPFEGHQKILEEEWRKGGEIRKGVHPGAFVVMPDHVHGLLRIEQGASELGRVIGAFKAAVSRRIRQSENGAMKRAIYESPVRRRGDSQIAPHSQIAPDLEFRIWQKQIAGRPCRAFGNPALLEMKKAGVLASGNATDEMSVIPELKSGWAWLSGFHSGQEEQVLRQSKAPCILIPAVRPDSVGLTPGQMTRLNAGTLLVLCPFEEERTTRTNALARNRLVAEWSDRLWIPSARKGGSLEKLKNEYRHKLI